MLDIFNDDAFSVQELTSAINVVPNKYGRIREIGLFAPKSVRTTNVVVEIKNGVLNLLPPTVRGGPASVGSVGKRSLKSFTIPNFSHEDVVLAEEVQNVRSFGTENQLMTVMESVNEKLETMRNKHAITLEWLRAGALRGTILDDQGNTILNLFTEFGVTQKEVDFVLGTDGTDVPAKIKEVKRHIETNLKGETMSGIHCLCSPTFFDALVAHPEVKNAYIYQQGQTIWRNDMRQRFEFQGVVFEEYIGSATDIDGNVRKFIVEGDARFFPLGTQDTFHTHYAPADFIETVNTRGLELYAKMERLKFDRGMELHTQMNPLPLVKRPELLVRGYSSN